jgi:acyl-CoA synthetase (NDP forming)
VQVPELSSDLQQRLAGGLPEEASLRNPVDMIATATADDYRRVLKTLIETDACDVILAIFVPALVTPAEEVAAAIREVAEPSRSVPIAAVFMTSAGPPSELSADGFRVPGYDFPEEAARAVALAARYGRWRERPTGAEVALDRTRPGQAAAILSRELGKGASWLSPENVSALFDCYSLPLVKARVAADAGAAAVAAEEIGFPVALKAVAPGLIHKTDAGGVRLALEDRAEVVAAAGEIRGSLSEAGYELEGLMVQPMESEGVEMIVGVVNDPSFGPVLACGAGGTVAELIKDVAVRITPITDLDARQMLRSLRTFPLLDGYRGAPRCDPAAIEDVLLRVAAMVETHPEIVELDCNPLIARPAGVQIIDARVRIEDAAPPPPLASLGT